MELIKLGTTHGRDKYTVKDEAILGYFLLDISNREYYFEPSIPITKTQQKKIKRIQKKLNEKPKQFAPEGF